MSGEPRDFPRVHTLCVRRAVWLASWYGGCWGRTRRLVSTLHARRVDSTGYHSTSWMHTLCVSGGPRDFSRVHTLCVCRAAWLAGWYGAIGVDLVHYLPRAGVLCRAARVDAPARHTPLSAAAIIAVRLVAGCVSCEKTLVVFFFPRVFRVPKLLEIVCFELFA